MAFSAKVITGTLPTSVSKDFTSVGFGSPDAAIVITSSAGSLGNPYSPSDIWSYGFWDSSNNQSCVGFRTRGSQSTSVTASIVHNNRIAGFINNSNDPDSFLEYSCAGITDGVRLSLSKGYSAATRNTVVILLKGVDAYAGAKELSSSTSPQTLGTGSAFTPNFVLTAVSGSSASINSGYARGAVALGVAMADGTQATVAYGAKHGATTEIINSIIRDDCVSVEAYDDAEGMKVVVSDMDNDEIELTLSASNPVRGMAYFALRLDDPGDAFIDIISTETSTGDKAYSPGVTPEVLGFLGTTLTSVNSLATSAPGATTMGAADSTDQAGIIQGNKDAVAPSAGFSRYDASNALNLRTDDDSAVTTASVKSLDAGSYTLNYSTADATARKVLVWGIGTASGGVVETVEPVGLAQAQTLSSPTLSATTNVSPAALSQSQTLTQPTLGVTTDVSPAGLTQAQSLTSPSLSAATGISPADLVQDQSLSQPVLLATVTLSPNDLAQVQALGAVTLASAGSIAPDALAQAQTLGSPSLTATGTLSPADLAQIQALTQPTLSGAGAVSPDSLIQSQTLSIPAIVAAGTLLPDDLHQLQSLSIPTLSQLVSLIVDDIAQTQGIDVATLLRRFIITPDALIQTQSVDDVALSVFAGLSVDDLLQSQRIDPAIVGVQGLWHAFDIDSTLYPAMTVTARISPRWSLQCTIKPILKH